MNPTRFLSSFIPHPLRSGYQQCVAVAPENG
jgi:hypothetical protein